MGKSYTWSKNVQSTEILDYSRRLRFNEVTKKFWFDLLGVKDGMKILEVGCGSGHFLEMLKQNFNVEVFGIDLDCEHIKYAKNSAKHKGLNINYQVADIKSLPFENESFDLVYSYTVVEHLPFENFISEQKRVLKQNGKVVVMNVENKQQSRFEFEYLNDDIYSGFNKIKIEKPNNIGVYSPNPNDKVVGLRNCGFSCVNLDFKNLLYYCPDNYFENEEFGLFQIEMSRLSAIADAEFVFSHSNNDSKEKDLADCLENINKKFDKRKQLFLSKIPVGDYQTTAVCIVTGTKVI